MGGFTEYAYGFMMSLFAHCYLAQLPPGTWFDVAIEDCMMRLSGMTLYERIHAEYFNMAAVTGRARDSIVELQNNEDDPERPIIRTAVVCLLDTVHQVPRSKGATQRSRDQGAEPHMNEARYEQMRALYPEQRDDEPFLGSAWHQRRYPLKGSEVWRSQILKLPLYMELCSELLRLPVPEGRVLIVDDALHCTPEKWSAWRDRCITQHRYEDRSRFEQEVLFQTHLQQHKLRRYMLWSDGQWRKFPATGTGEADIKVLHYLQPGIGARRFLVVNQDKDLIFVLLLHMFRLVELASEQADDEEPLEIWLDTNSPRTKKGEEKPYRYINIVALYWGIKELFAREYPKVLYPVETFCFLVFMRKTDFVQPLCGDCPERKSGHRHCLCISDADAWNLFSELHSAHPDGFLLFTSKAGETPRRSRERYWSQDLHGLLNSAITYDCPSRQFFFNHAALQRFYYLLFQQKLMRLRLRLRLPVPLADSVDLFAPVRAAGLDPHELLIYAQDVADRLEAYRRLHTQGENRLVQKLLPGEDGGQTKQFKPSSARGKLVQRKKPEEEETDMDVEEEPEEWLAPEPVVSLPRGTVNTAETRLAQYLLQNAPVLRELSQRFLYRKYHNVPVPETMLLRLYDLELYMSYLRDGWWKGAEAALELTQCSALDDELQVWPYEARLLEGEERTRALNSTHYWQRQRQDFTEHPYDLLEVHKSARVIHRRYCERVPLHV